MFILWKIYVITTLRIYFDFLDETTPTSQHQTVRDILSSINKGFRMRKRSGKRISPAAQIEQSRAGLLDLETPDSILLKANLRQLINNHTFSELPTLYQYKLIGLLPDVDRVVGPDNSLK